MKTNRTRVSQLENNMRPHLSINFNDNNDMHQFQNDNKHINLLINNVLGKPIFLSRNNGPVKVVIVDMIDRYGIIKP